MKKTNPLLWLQTVLCVLLALLLAAAALDIYHAGSARRKADPSAPIYTVEAVATHAKAPLAASAAVVVTTVLCAALGVRDENAEKPVRSLARPPLPTAANAKRRRAARTALLVLAAACIVAGVCNGSMKDVLIKAINICTECVGLG